MNLHDYDTLRDLLLRHLPRPARGMPMTVDDDGVRIEAPGVAVADIVAMLGDLFGHEDVLPDGMVPEGLVIETLDLVPNSENFGADLSFVVAWRGSDLGLGDGVALSMARSGFENPMARIGFEKHGKRMLGFAEAELTIDDLVLDVVLELPSQIIRGTLAPEKHAAAGEMLGGRGMLPKGAELHSLAVEAALLYDSFEVHVELQRLLKIGDVAVEDVMAQLSLSDGEVAAEVEAKLVVPAAHLVLAVEGSVDGGGWRLAGTLDIGAGGLRAGDLLEHLGGEGARLPSVVADAALVHLGAEVDTRSGQTSFDMTLDWKHDAELLLHVDKSEDDIALSGTLLLNELVFALNFDAGEAEVLVASFDAAGHAKISLDQVLSALSAQAAGAQGTGIALELKALGLALDGEGRVLMGAAVGAGIDLTALSSLPLLGTMIAKDASLGLTLSPAYKEAGFAAEDQALGHMPEGLVWPDPLEDGLQIGARLTLAGLERDLPNVVSPGDGSAAAPPEPDTPAAAAETVSGVEVDWIDVDRAIGPLHVSRVGVGLAAPLLDLEIDADLSLAGLHVAVMGLGARYNFDTRQLTPRLEGLGLSIDKGDMHIGGSFLNLGGDFAGQVRIKTEAFGLSAMGAYKMLNGTPAMFVFGALVMPLGGPVFFFVDGLAAGFGLHRALTLPKLDALRQFPLISSATAAAAGEIEDMSADTQIARLHDHVRPKMGVHFLAAGIKFNSFKLLNGYAVVIVSFGEKVEIDLLGTADFVTPPETPPGMPALARIGLNLIARLDPDAGRLTVEAKITPESYVYGPLCHLSGGFAFYAWTKGARAGDFVLSLGGYHPEFHRPDDYPVVHRLEMRYQVSDAVFLKGSAYFAMTPAVMMAGGALHAQADIGALRAWADLTVDFIVAWEPFHYDAHMHVEIGAKWKCFHTTASADLHIWGPPFSGTAQVDWAIFGFEVHFGAKKPSRPRAIAIEKFNRSFLQITDAASANAMLGLQARAGVIGQIGDVPILTPAELSVALSTRIPVRSAVLGDKDALSDATDFGVAPAGRKKLGASTVTVKVISRTDGSDFSGNFELVGEYSGMPPALWGQTVRVDQNAKPVPGLSGMTLRPAKRSESGGTIDQPAHKLWSPPGMSMPRARAFVAFGSSRPTPDTLPLAELATLGLETEGLEAVIRTDVIVEM
jgi:hypothetical protein